MEFATTVNQAISKFKKKAQAQGLTLPVVSIEQMPASEVVEIDGVYEITRYVDYTVFDYHEGRHFSGTLIACIEAIYRWKGLTHADPNRVELKITPEECHTLIQALGLAWHDRIQAKDYGRAKEISKLKNKIRDQHLQSFLKDVQ